MAARRIARQEAAGIQWRPAGPVIVGLTGLGAKREGREGKALAR